MPPPSDTADDAGRQLRNHSCTRSPHSISLCSAIALFLPCQHHCRPRPGEPLSCSQHSSPGVGAPCWWGPGVELGEGGAHLIPAGSGGRERHPLPPGHLWAPLGGLYFFLKGWPLSTSWKQPPPPSPAGTSSCSDLSVKRLQRAVPAAVATAGGQFMPNLWGPGVQILPLQASLPI